MEYFKHTGQSRKVEKTDFRCADYPMTPTPLRTTSHTFFTGERDTRSLPAPPTRS